MRSGQIGQFQRNLLSSFCLPKMELPPAVVQSSVDPLLFLTPEKPHFSTNGRGKGICQRGREALHTNVAGWTLVTSVRGKASQPSSQPAGEKKTTQFSATSEKDVVLALRVQVGKFTLVSVLARSQIIISSVKWKAKALEKRDERWFFFLLGNHCFGIGWERSVLGVAWLHRPKWGHSRTLLRITRADITPM